MLLPQNERLLSSMTYDPAAGRQDSRLSWVQNGGVACALETECGTRQGGPDVVLHVWVAQQQEGLVQSRYEWNQPG